jgi:purine-nucleoside phosphorylase
VNGLADQIDAAADAIRNAARGLASEKGAAKVGVILGSGLGALADRIDDATAIPYAELPHFPRSTAAGHAGKLIFGTLRDTGRQVVALQGRFHLYEGWNAQQAAFPVWVMKRLGVETLVVSNAAGGLNPSYQVGDVMLIDDHINFMFKNPLTGVNDDRLGPRFPDMSAPYDRELIELAETVARREGFFCPRGVYVGMLGPTYETRAEYRMARRLGGDAAACPRSPK